MKSNELRIGNLVNIYLINSSLSKDMINKRWLHRITSLSKSTICYEPINENPTKNHNLHYDIEPIPLTEEWLKRAMFKKQYKYHKVLLTAFVYLEVLKAKEDYNCYLTQKGKRELQFIFRKIKYVHELQNLYFALTGSELVFSEA